MVNKKVKIRHIKAKQEPTTWKANAVYYIYDSDTQTFSIFITDLQGVPVSIYTTATTTGVLSVTGSGVTGTLPNPIININTFKSAESGNLIELSVQDGKLFVKPITSPNSSIEITSTASELQIQIDATLLNLINSAIQSGDNISELNNDAQYITLGEVPAAPTNLTYTASSTQGIVNSDTGSDATLPAATNTNAGLLLPTEKLKIAANTTDVTLTTTGTGAATLVGQVLNIPIPAAGSEVIVLVQESSQIVNQVLDSTKVYVIENEITLTSGEHIEVPATGLTLIGYGFNISSIFSSVVNHNIFISPSGGSGDIILDKLSITNVGTGSKVFNLVDGDGTHAIEVNDVNFSGCKSIGKISDYRQGTFTTVGLYGCTDGLQLSGAWNGFKITNTNIFSFGSTGCFIKKDADTLFTNRLFLNINLDLPTGAKVIDFDETNFSLPELLQINSSIAKVNGVIDINNADSIIPNISANNSKCLWIGNIGLPDTASENFIDDSSVSGTLEINWLIDTYYLEMSADTVFSETNLPASGKNTQEIKIYLTGEYIPTFPPDWLVNAVGTYKGSDVNEITVKYIKSGVYFMKISNSFSVYPAPSLQYVSPASILPSATSLVTVYGSFYTPQTIVSIENQTVNTVTFINQGELELSVTTGASEDEFDMMISNGTTETFNDAIIVNAGEVSIPVSAEWEAPTGSVDVSENGKVKVVTYEVVGTNRWDKILEYNDNWYLRFKIAQTPLGYTANNEYGMQHIILVKASDNSFYAGLNIRREGGGDVSLNVVDTSSNPTTSNIAFSNSQPTSVLNFEVMAAKVYEFRCISSILFVYVDGMLAHTFPGFVTEDLKLKIQTKSFDIVSIKKILIP